MKIGIIGAGNIGANAARLFVQAGHVVTLANSRGPESLQTLVAEIGALATTIEGGANIGEIIFISIPFGQYKSLPSNVFAGKIVIDSNNYYPGRDGKFAELDNDATTSSELLAAHLQGARVVKGFNTIWFEHLKTQGNTSLPLAERRAIFIAGDDAEAKEIVSKLIAEIGFAAVDTGSLHDGGKRQQPGTTIYNQVLTATAAREVLAAD